VIEGKSTMEETEKTQKEWQRLKTRAQKVNSYQVRGEPRFSLFSFDKVFSRHKRQEPTA